MAQVEEDLDITREGLDCLDALSDQLRELVFKMAEAIALADNPGLPRHEIVVESDQVRAAVRELAALLRAEFSKGHATPGVRQVIEEITRHVDEGNRQGS